MPHQRRKSGHQSGNTSMTDVRKAVVASDTRHKRPAMSRRQTPVNAQMLGRSQREREREREWHESWEDERESFPQFCMTCEKQFVPRDEKFLYCSESCRRVDQNSTSPPPPSMRAFTSGSHYNSGSSEPRDIIPRASPSRPSSMLLHSSPPATPGRDSYGGYYAQQPQTYHHSSAVSALRSLNVRPPSPPSPTGSSSGGSMWPFSRSAATSPANSYTRPTAGFFSSTFDGGYSGYAYDMGDRPLPSRHPGGSHRPKSIELVTPMVGR